MNKSTKRKDPDLITIEEAASILGVGQQRIQEYFHHGRLTRKRASNGELRLSQAEVKRAAHIDGILADWPEPSQKQLRWMWSLIEGVQLPPAGPSEYELEQRRKMQEREAALKRAQKAALALTACDVCNLQPNEHQYSQRRGIDSHDWQPGRADKIMGANVG